MGVGIFFCKKNSGSLAKDRLKLLLVSDRVNCSPEVLEMIRADIVKAISKYIEIDTEELEIRILQAGTEEGERGLPALFANVPIRSVKCYNRQTI
ncbi:MAG: cell division topological specificity factor MinE [Clostridiales bacterium]|nr:cell division topological specificity factor MinE [Clostridiales bacterium]